MLIHSSQVSTLEAHWEMLFGQYNFTDPDIIKTSYHERVIHRSLARHLPSLIMEIWNELQFAIDMTWGNNTEEWKDICVWSNSMEIISRASNRILVGKPTCRDEDYLRNMAGFADDVIRSCVILNLTPSILRPLVAPLIVIPNHIHHRRTAQYTIPIIQERQAQIRRKKEEPEFKYEEPNDYISWHTNLALSEGRKDQMDPLKVSRGLLALNFAAIHTTSLTITNTLFDLLGSPNSEIFMSAISEEITRVYRECNGEWTKASLNRLVRTDSAIRESMRYSNFQHRGIARKVVTPHGVENEAEGWTAPKGTWFAVNAHEIHHDEEIYPNANTFDAFRFSRPREEFEVAQKSRKGEEGSEEHIGRQKEYLRVKNLSLASTSDSFLPFGHGRHAW
jgi:hypothetical protein